MDGSRATAETLFRVADRIVANMHEPTDIPAALLPPPPPNVLTRAGLIKEIEELEAEHEPLPPIVRPLRFYSLGPILVLAVALALVVATLVTPWR